MRKLSWVCCIALLLCLLCGAAWAENVATGTDACQHEGGWWTYDDNHHWYVCYACDAENIKYDEHNFVKKHNENGHWDECTECGTTKNRSYSHTALCTKPGICKDCGYEDANMDAPHRSGYWADGAMCVNGCLECKEEYWVSKHLADCANTGVCKYCGATGAFTLSHHPATMYDDTYHYEKCTVCGEVSGKTKHSASCRTPNECRWCDYTGNIDNLSHITELESDGAAGHHYKCLNCGYKEENNSHYANCSDPTHCTSCGYEGEISWINHSGTEKTVSVGVKGHYTQYTCCGTKGNVNNHEAKCSDLMHCTSCDYEGETSVIWHSGKWTTVSDGAKGHYDQYSCCGKKSSVYVHEAVCSDPTHCIDCDYEGEIDWINHPGTTTTVSDGAAGHCTQYSCCGAKGTVNAHEANCSDPTHCTVCDYEGEIDRLSHSGTTTTVSDGAKGHHTQYSCCDKKGEINEHWANCSDPTHCIECGYEGVMGWVNHSEMWTTVSDGATGHHYQYSCCGTKENITTHFADCDDPTHCTECGYEGEMYVSHRDNHVVSDGELGHHDECSLCGKKEPITAHYANCNAPTHCVYCDYEGTDIDIDHHPMKTVSDGAEGHHTECLVCKKTLTEIITHFANCTATDVCTECGYESADIEKENGVIWHNEPSSKSDFERNETQHWYTCKRCKQVVTANHWANVNGCGEKNAKCEGCGYAFPAEHTWKVVSAEKPHQEKCAVCRKTRTTAHVAACDAPGVCKVCGVKNSRIPVEPHDWVATATKDGVTTYTCAACSKTKTENTGATIGGEKEEPTTPDVNEKAETTTPSGGSTSTHKHTHTWGACVANGDGTHTKTCATCEKTSAASCSMTAMKIGTLDAFTCEQCGYITWAQDGAEQTKQENKPVENASFTLLDADGKEIDAKDMTLVVHESSPEGTVQLADGAQAVVCKALTVSLVEGNAPITLENTVKLDIPVEEDVTGLKLVVVDENGQLVEIEYEIIDGKMVFETNILGIFLLVEEV